MYSSSSSSDEDEDEGNNNGDVTSEYDWEEAKEELIEWKDEDGNTALHLAFQNEEPLDIIENMLEIGGVELIKEKNEDGNTALHLAFQDKAPLDIIEKMLEIGGVELIEEKNEDGYTALHEACRFDAPLEVIEKILEVGGVETAKVKTSSGHLPLSFIASGDDIQVIQALIHAAPADENNPRQKSLWKVMSDNPGDRAPVYQWLFQEENTTDKEAAKKDLLEAKNGLGNTALHLACERRSSFAVIAKIMEIGGVEAAKAKGYLGRLPLYYAWACRCDPKVCQALIDANHPEGPQLGPQEKPLWKVMNDAKPEHRSQDWAPVYQWLFQENIDKEAAKKDLLEAKTGRGDTALHLACERRASFDIIAKILEIGGVETAKVKGYSGLPLHYAWKSGVGPEVCQALIDANPEGPRLRSLLAVIKEEVKQDWSPVYRWLQTDNVEDLQKKFLKETGYGDTPLHLLCERKAPLDIIERILEIGGGETAKVKDFCGRLPLHIAWKHQCDPKVCQALIDANPEGPRLRSLFTVIEEEVKQDWSPVYRWLQAENVEDLQKKFLKETSYGNTPLHLLCERKAPLDIIERILEIGGVETAKVKNVDERLPLHVAWEHQCDPKVIQALIDANPEGPRLRSLLAVIEKVKQDWSPVYRWLNQENIDKEAVKKNLLEEKYDGYTALHLACKKRASLDIIEKILEVGGDETAKQRSSYIGLPLHCAWKHQCDQKVCQALIDAFPEGPRLRSLLEVIQEEVRQDWSPVYRWLQAENVGGLQRKFLKEKDQAGNTPLHLLCKRKAPLDIIEKVLEIGGVETAKVEENSGRLPLYEACRYKCCFEVMQVLIDAFPEGARMKVGKKLPLHLVCENKMSFQVIQALIKVYPQGVLEEDGNRKVPMIAVRPSSHMISTAVRERRKRLMEKARDESINAEEAPFTREAMDAVEATFKQMDLNGDMAISRDEFCRICSFGSVEDHLDIDDLLNIFYKNSDDAISASEFVLGLAGIKKRQGIAHTQTLIKKLEEKAKAYRDAEEGVAQALFSKGVSLGQLLDFVQTYSYEKGLIKGSTTTYEVVRDIIIPETAGEKCCMADRLGPKTPTTLMSHWWGNRFLTLVRCCCEYAAGRMILNKEMYTKEELSHTFWLCIFAVNQHVSICGTEWNPCNCNAEKFKAGHLYCQVDKFPLVMKRMKNHALALDNKLDTLKRVWVLSEIAGALGSKNKMKTSFCGQPNVEIMKDIDLDVKMIIPRVKDAEASHPEDKAMIIESIEMLEGGVEKFDATISHAVELEIRRIQCFHNISRKTVAANMNINNRFISRVFGKFKDHDVLEALNTPDTKGRGETVIMVAARKGQVNVVRSLLEQGVDLSIRTKSLGWTVLHYAAIYIGHSRSELDYKKQGEILEMLLKQGKGCDPNCKNAFGRTAYEEFLLMHRTDRETREKLAELADSFEIMINDRVILSKYDYSKMKANMMLLRDATTDAEKLEQKIFSNYLPEFLPSTSEGMDQNSKYLPEQLPTNSEEKSQDSEHASVMDTEFTPHPSDQYLFCGFLSDNHVHIAYSKEKRMVFVQFIGSIWDKGVQGVEPGFPVDSPYTRKCIEATKRLAGYIRHYWRMWEFDQIHIYGGPRYEGQLDTHCRIHLDEGTYIKMKDLGFKRETLFSFETNEIYGGITCLYP